MECRKLGRKAIKTDTRTLKLARYFTSQLPAPPLCCDWTRGISEWGMLLNDKLGCCTIAGVAHAVQVFSLNLGNEAAITDDVVLRYYQDWDGYVPGSPNTDNGGIELDVLKLWRTAGFNGHKLFGFADVQPMNNIAVKQAIALFGGLYIGVNLPLSAQGQNVWDIANGPRGIAGSWGGHCVFVVQYDAAGLTCITWGKLQRMTWAFWNRYVDECHALLSADFINATDASPSGFNLTALQVDLMQVSQ